MREGTEQLTKACASLSQVEEVEYVAAYDDLLWRVVTAGSEELAQVVEEIWIEPYSNLPVPLAVTLCRIYALLPDGSPDLKKQAQDYVIAYCSPDEEIGATEGFRIK